MEFFSIAFFALIAAAAHFIAARQGYFRFPYEESKTESVVTVQLLIASFVVYFLATLLLGPLVAKHALRILHAMHPEITTLSVLAICALQAALMIFILLLLFMLIGRRLPSIWKEGKKSSAAFDFGLGAATWLLGFPLVTVIGDLSDWVLNHLFGIQYYEQAAVKFLKTALQAPGSLMFAILAVIILAPLLEEMLFRGLLQNYLRSKLGRKAAILLSAIIFAGFHFSPAQGLGNISLSLSLLILGIYLGFLYERQQSLLAPLGLHMSFNSINALRILFYPESS